VPTASCPIIGHHQEESGSVFFTAFPSDIYEADKIDPHPKPSLPVTVTGYIIDI